MPRETVLTPEGLEELKDLKSLQTLGLGFTILKKGLKQLKSLNLSNTRVTEAGVAELRKALPNCQIKR